MKFPSVDNTAIFDFIEEVRSNAVNNALVPFRDFADIESYLRQQWAGMMFSFLAAANESSRVADTLSVMQEMSERNEMLSRQILSSVGTERAKMTAALYDTMLSHNVTRTLQDWGWSITPIVVLQNETIVKCAKALGKTLKAQAGFDYESILPQGVRIKAERVELAWQDPIEYHGREQPKYRIESTITKDGDVHIDERRLEELSSDYARMRKEFQKILKKFAIPVERYLADEAPVSEVRPSRKRSSPVG